MEKYKKLHGKSQQQDEDEDSNYVDKKFKALTTELDKIVKKKQKRSSSNESSSSERNYKQMNRAEWLDNRRVMNRNNEYRPKRGNSRERHRSRGRSHEKRYNKDRSRDRSLERKRSNSRGRSHEKRYKNKNRSRDLSRERKMFSIRGRSHEKRYNRDRSRDRTRERKIFSDRNRSRSKDQRVNYRDKSGEDRYRHRDPSRDKVDIKSRNSREIRPKDNYRNRSKSMDDSREKRPDKKMSISPRKSSESSSPEIKKPQSSAKPFGLVTASGEKIETSNTKEIKRYTREELKPKRDAPKKHEKSAKTQLTEEEKEKRFHEMLSNANWREKDREHNVKKYNDEVEKERKTFEKDFDRDFINRSMKHAQAQIGSLESRIKSNVNNIQRSGQSMNQNFAKR